MILGSLASPERCSTWSRRSMSSRSETRWRICPDLASCTRRLVIASAFAGLTSAIRDTVPRAQVRSDESREQLGSGTHAAPAHCHQGYG